MLQGETALWPSLAVGAVVAVAWSLPAFGLVRVVDYPDPYPNRSTKIVTLEDLSRGSPSSVTLHVEASRVGDG